MTWIKLDDTFPDHPKVAGLPPSAVTLYIFGLCYASRHLTDGHLTRASIATLGLPKWRSSATQLVSSGLWSESENGYLIHDYLEHQRSAEEVRELSKKRAAAGRKGGAKAKQIAKQTGSKLSSKTQAEADTETEPSSSPPTHHDPPVANGAASGGEDDQVEQTLNAIFDHMARCDLEVHTDRGNTVRNRTAWLRAAAGNRREAHEVDARHELTQRTRGIHYPLHVEIAETLDPACGPDDGGKARADAEHQATLRLLEERRGA